MTLPYVCGLDMYFIIMISMNPMKMQVITSHSFFIFNSFWERGGREGGREGEKHWCERETLISWLLYAPNLGTNPAPTAWACALTGNWTGGLSLCRMMLNPLSHTGQGYFSFLKILDYLVSEHSHNIMRLYGMHCMIFCPFKNGK